MDPYGLVLADVEIAVPPVSATTACVVISLILIALLYWLSTHVTATAYKVVILLIAAIAVFGIAGPLAATRPVATLQHTIMNVLSAGVATVGAGATVYLFVIILIAALGLRYFWRKRTLVPLIVLMITWLPLLAYPDFQGITLWYINHVGVPLYDALPG